MLLKHGVKAFPWIHFVNQYCQGHLFLWGLLANSDLVHFTVITFLLCFYASHEDLGFLTQYTMYALRRKRNKQTQKKTSSLNKYGVLEVFVNSSRTTVLESEGWQSFFFKIIKRQNWKRVWVFWISVNSHIACTALSRCYPTEWSAGWD